MNNATVKNSTVQMNNSMAYANMQQLVSHWSTIIPNTENTRKKRGRDDDDTNLRSNRPRAQYANTLQHSKN